MRRPAALFPIVLALGAMMLAPVAGAQERGGRAEGPTEIEKCQTINQPGSYKLVKNLATTSGNCIVIAVDNVTIDLAGFSITGGAGITGAGVSVVGGSCCEGSLSGTGRSQISATG
jgi:hypothetical protein